MAQMAPGLPLIVVAIAALLAAAVDVRRFRVPNWITFPLFFTGIAYNVLLAGWTGLCVSLLGAAFGFAILFLFYVLGGVGAGDIKLLTAVGAWLGIALTFWIFIVAGLATGVYSLAVIVWRGSLGQAVTGIAVMFYQVRAIGVHLANDGERVESIVNQDDRRRRLVPFGAMVALGVIFVLVWAYRNGAL